MKELMISDFFETKNHKTNQELHQKWFTKFQEFALTTGEPLVEIYVFGFLSDKTNETYDFYLQDLATNTYYNELLDRLQKKYPTSSLTEQYKNELIADKTLVDLNGTTTKASSYYYLLIFLPIVLLSIWAITKRLSNQKKFNLLSKQEATIAKAILSEKSNKEIAESLFISHSTIKTHINTIYKKLNVNSRTEFQRKYKNYT